MPCPSAYALNKLRNFEWVELFYFTPEQCDAALEDHGGERSSSNETFSFSEVNGVVALHPVVFRPHNTIHFSIDTRLYRSILKFSSLNQLFGFLFCAEHMRGS